jgi:hypothetical protein
MTSANLVVAAVGNSAAMSMSIEQAAKQLIRNGKVDDGRLNMVEMAFRAYGPCLSCATRALPGEMLLEVSLRDPRGTRRLHDVPGRHRKMVPGVREGAGQHRRPRHVPGGHHPVLTLVAERGMLPTRVVADEAAAPAACRDASLRRLVPVPPATPRRAVTCAEAGA